MNGEYRYGAHIPVERRRGGWFVIDDVAGWSGPWKTEEAAKAARAGEYDEAERLCRETKQ